MINCLSFSTAFGGVDSGVFRLLATMEIRSVGSVKREGGEVRIPTSCGGSESGMIWGGGVLRLYI